MKSRLMVGVMVVAALSLLLGAAPNAKTHIMDVELLRPVKGAEGVQILNVTIFEKVTKEQAAEMLKQQLQICVSVLKPTDGILATAWDADENQILPSGDKLIYDAKTKKIMTMDEHEGVSRKGQDRKDYFVETEEGKTAKGIKPEKQWLTITLVYFKPPAVETAYAAAVNEAEQAAAKGLDVTVYVSVGAKGDRANWEQLKDPDGGYVFVNYDAKTKTIKKKSKVLKTLDK
jgi:hypothetical protein